MNFGVKWNDWHIDQKIYHFLTVKIPKKYAEFQKIISDIAIPILMSLPLLYMQNGAFCIGCALGFIFEHKAREISEKVAKAYHALASTFSRTVLVSGVIVSIIYYMPAANMMAALYFSSLWGAKLSYWSKGTMEILGQTHIN